MKSIVGEIEELRAMTGPELVDRYRAVVGAEPRIKNKAWLWRRLAWRLQEQRLGGLTRPAKARLEEIIAELDLPLDGRPRRVTGAVRGPRRPDLPAVGTVLTRQWHGQEIRVEALEDGFEWDGVVYRSLSAVAKAVTGARWNGKLFFGLKKRKRAKA